MPSKVVTTIAWFRVAKDDLKWRKKWRVCWWPGACLTHQMALIKMTTHIE